MPYAQCNGQDLYFEVTGTGEPVLLSHGFLMDRTMWEPQVAELSASYTCVTWDQRGFGKTKHTARPFDLWDSARDGVALLDHLGIEKANLVGMSQGGYLSMRAAIRYPDRVKTVALIDTDAGGLTPEERAGYTEFFQSWVDNREPTDDHLSTMSGLLLGTDDLAATWLPRWRAVNPDSLGSVYLAALSEENILSQLADVQAPLMVIHGTADAVFPVAKAEAIGRAAGNCVGVHRIDGGSHTANLTHPKEVNALLADFLRTHA